MKRSNEMKNKGGRPRRSDEKLVGISIQLPESTAQQYIAAAKALGMNKSTFGEYLFKKWQEQMKKVD